ncbi:hypothetical protein NA57DRAFT_70960 [Rhizodiscina lignyota]|uniref:BTB domain-containing protein n=1 Tax=Rhizodiscina lignyota TaxID=1504668 RepID=A0A9P4ISW7_9PEZI|nr:hypothetical protein NA57DRAFT_70960 [Rhizodiscina lignyota]
MSDDAVKEKQSTVSDDPSGDTPRLETFSDRKPLAILLPPRGLLTKESNKILKELNGPFKEAKELKIDLSEEDSLLFAHFVKYLYSEKPCEALPTVQNGHVSTYVLLARLYAMGERLWAPKFKDAILRNFTATFDVNTAIPEHDLCELLKIACEEITERVPEDDEMRRNIFWFASCRLTNLQRYPDFTEVMLETYPELGRQLALRAGNPAYAAQPPRPKGALESRFRNEFLSVAKSR